MKRIEFSGCDGSGKTTALYSTVEFLQNLGYRVLHSREVGNPHIESCVKLRSLALDPTSKIDGKTMELICAAMRIENELFYRSVADKYDVLVSDRGYLDHLAYGDVNCSPEFTKELFIDCVSKYTSKPDIVFFFDISTQEAKKRRAMRGDVVDAIEAKGDEFQQKVAERFKAHIEGMPNVHVIDAGLSATAVFKQVQNVLMESDLL